MHESRSVSYDDFWAIFESFDKNLLATKSYELKKEIERFAINFNLFKDGAFLERNFPFDVVPRIISKNEFLFLEKGLKQRIEALNCFLNDIYSEQKIVKDGVIPQEFVLSSKYFLPSYMNCLSPKNIRTHISGIDLVKDSVTGKWVILEDNLRVPSGVSYPLSIRKIYRKIFPEFFENISIAENSNYPNILMEMMRYVNTGGISVILTPGRYNSAFYEHGYLSKHAGTYLVSGEDLTVIGNKLCLKNYDGQMVRVGALYRRIDDEFLDPVEFNHESMIGVPNLAQVYRSGNVAIVNAIGNGIADDKGIYYFVPKMIKYYLGEDAILQNAETFLPYYEKDMKYVMDNLSNLVIKDVAEAGGYGVSFGNRLSSEMLEKIRYLIKTEPRRFIAQHTVEFYDIECVDRNFQTFDRKADLRMYIVYGKDITVWKSGLTRYAVEEKSYLVNSSQGGGYKDTWVLEE